MDVRITTECKPFDEMIKEGFASGTLSLIYGEPKTGKTTIVIQCAVNCAKKGRKSIFIDCDKTLFPTRLAQISKHDKSILNMILVLSPESFEEQKELIERLESYITPKVSLIAIDTFTSLYRAELNSMEKTFMLNRELNFQLACLSKIAKEKGVAVVITSQIHSVMGGGVEPLADRLLRYWCDTIVYLRSIGRGMIEARLEKHPMVEQPHSRCFFKISESGISALDTQG